MDVLSDVHRRRLLIALLEESPQTVETDSASEESRTDERAVLMWHVHLPKLEDFGYIDWDRESTRVTKGPRFEELKPLLTRLNRN